MEPCADGSGHDVILFVRSSPHCTIEPPPFVVTPTVMAAAATDAESINY